jgi:hypothetical protein
MHPFLELTRDLEQARRAAELIDRAGHGPAFAAVEAYVHAAAQLFGRLLADELLARAATSPGTPIAALVEAAIAAAWETFLGRQLTARKPV